MKKLILCRLFCLGLAGISNAQTQPVGPALGSDGTWRIDSDWLVLFEDSEDELREDDDLPDWIDHEVPEDDGELARKLANPVASLISFPIQANYDKDVGANDQGSVWLINIQPVIPFSISEDWNLISRTILPVIDQQDIPVNGQSEFGLGDTLQSLFFSPKDPTASGLIWGIGPAILLDTASDDTLGRGKWGIGPTVVLLKQEGPWTTGILMNHIESFSGDSGRDDISATFFQPFFTYITETRTTFALNTESTYNWETEKWAVPLNFSIRQLFAVNEQRVQVGAGARYWAEAPDSGPEGWGLRLELTFLFPR